MLPLLEAAGNEEEKYDHLYFIRNKYLVLSLAEQAAIQNFFQTINPKLFPNLENEMKSAKQLMDPSNSVLRFFHKGDQDFPHSPYDGPEWRDFLIMCGLMHEIAHSGLLAYARQLSISSLQDMDYVTEKAKVLLEYIFDKRDEFEV